jgi:hypothetical protein
MRNKVTKPTMSECYVEFNRPVVYSSFFHDLYIRTMYPSLFLSKVAPCSPFRLLLVLPPSSSPSLPPPPFPDLPLPSFLFSTVTSPPPNL